MPARWGLEGWCARRCSLKVSDLNVAGDWRQGRGHWKDQGLGRPPAHHFGCTTVLLSCCPRPVRDAYDESAAHAAPAAAAAPAVEVVSFTLDKQPSVLKAQGRASFKASPLTSGSGTEPKAPRMDLGAMLLNLAERWEHGAPSIGTE